MERRVEIRVFIILLFHLPLSLFKNGQSSIDCQRELSATTGIISTTTVQHGNHL